MQSMSPSPSKLNNKSRPNKLTYSQIETESNTETGMYFPDTVLAQFKCDRKSLFTEVVTHDLVVKLTTEGFADIPITSIFKIKFYTNKMQGKITLKLQTDKQQHYFHLFRQDIASIFTKLLWLRLATMNIFTELNPPSSPEIASNCLKKGEFMGKWQPKYLRISEKGLQVLTEEKGKVDLRVESTSELWTRFEMINNSEYLVVKLWAGVFKHEIGVPIGRRVTGWMQAFCNLLRKQ